MIIFNIEKQLPSLLKIKNSNRYLLEGWAFGEKRIKKIYALVGEQRFEAIDIEIFRPDVARNYSTKDTKLFSLFSGFSIPVIIEQAKEMHERTVELVFVLSDGKECKFPQGTIKLEVYNNDESIIKYPESITKDKALVAICMATYNPEEFQFQRQIDSIINQSYDNWICIVNDDCSTDEKKRLIKKIIGRDPRFYYYENSKNLGFYHNFERCLELVPADVDFIALSDQDDEWFPDKISETLNEFKENCQLVYCDMRIVKESGEIISNTYWSNRKNYYESKDIDLLSIANTVTGAASVFRRDLLNSILPFPPRYGNVFHDQWIAILAAAKGGIRYVDRPLYNYMQSDLNVIGHTDFGKKSATLVLKEIELSEAQRNTLQDLPKIRKIKRKLKFLISNIIKSSMMGYEFKHLSAKHIVTLIETAKIRDIDKFYIALLNRPLSLYGLCRIHRKVIKQGETLNNLEISLILSNIINKIVRSVVIPLRKPLFKLIKNRQIIESSNKNDMPQNVPVSIIDPSILEYRRKFSGRNFVVDENNNARINLLLSSVDPKNFFGGYIGMYNFAKKLYKLGHNVRVLVTDQMEINPDDLSKIINHDETLKEFMSKIEFQSCFSNRQEIAITQNDIFIATSWWTAHLAEEAVKKTKYEKFIYLAQDYEPVFYEHGGYRVLAEHSYSLNYIPFFSTDILQRYFVENGYLSDNNKGNYFNNPVLNFNIKNIEKRKDKKKLLFYGRPQPQNARNLYPIGTLAIDRAFELKGLSRDEWEVIAIGGDVAEQILPSGIKINHIGKFDIANYKNILPQHDLGFALMDSPHPSLLPIEMASAGLIVVTNTYGIKNQEYFKNISENIIAVPPDIDSLAIALIEAAKQVDNYDLRRRGSEINWPHTWDEALPDEKIKKVMQENYALDCDLIKEV
ncbi:rhamnosyltransferase WsaF family glycosyltransferase [Paenibacillus puerhi]|uniref:rhamnosyltransferase WsaF family glycosyltransferase n=1 Tax=Paenibacillus puerhi TaxID=2692622 RepID=UPI00135CD635|nr:glycosyltransferase [Paenibacillus puerhi]